jgi:hypothetical protein
MTKFKVNDIVRIIKKPSVNQHIQLLGVVGYITDFSEDGNYIEFEEIKFNSFCGGRGSVDIDCIEHYDSIEYNNRFQEILEKKRKEDEHQNLIFAYQKLEDKFDENTKLIYELEKEIVTIKNIDKLLKSNDIDTENILSDEINRKETTIRYKQSKNEELTEEMNTPINKGVAWYLDCQRHG